MAASLTESATLARDAGFLDRVRIAFCACGATVIATEPYDPAVPDSLPRRGLYLNAISDLDRYVAVMAWTVAAQPAITAESSDAEITDAVQALWSAMAGA